MTYSQYRDYSFTAFSEADLLSGGNTNINCGDTFTMPGAATVCFDVRDNDKNLSGDKHNRNDHAADHSGQTAKIEGPDGTEIGNGGQIFAEKYFWVKDQAGNWYVMIEIEQEGTHDDYFTFHSGYGVPPAGAQLTIHSEDNISNCTWSPNYNVLGAGEKEAKDPWAFDEETCTYTVEAECFDLHGFKAVEGDQASGGELVRISGHDGKISTDFGGTSGVYNMSIRVQDETDGISKLKVFVNGEFQQMIKLDGQSDGHGSDNGGFSTITLEGLEIAAGDKVEIRAWRDGNEFVRIDAIEFEQVKFEVCDTPGAVKLDFEAFATGQVLGDLDGLTISATGGSGDAMIFDSQNPTGGDSDLETRAAQQGNVLIVSEDGDSSDPDDVAGGTLTFDFDNPANVFDLKVIDTEEGGTITLTLADGSTQTFDIPNLVNGGVGQVVMDVDNVVSMEVALNGSGAIDDLCYVPGAAPLPGSLSGRFFMDTDNDNQDNGNGGEPAIAGVVVELLNADGTGTGITTVTAADGTYSFGGLDAGTYGVAFTDPDGVLDGKALVDANVGDDASDSDAIGDTTLSTISTITVVAGENTPDNDAGAENLPGSLSGRYFLDDNRNDVDDSEPGVAGVTVMLLDENGDPATDINGNPVASVTTGANGAYSFGNLAAGVFAVKFTDAVTGGELAAANQGDDDAIDSDATDLGGGMSIIEDITVVAGENTPDNDAGVQVDPGNASIGDTVWFDTDRDGTLNNGETGADGVEVKLLADTDGDGDIDDVVATATTAGGGQYLFDNLDAGDYKVMFGDLAGFEFTTPGGAADDAVDGDSDAGAGGMTDTITLSEGEAERDIDAGLVRENDAPELTDDAAKTCADEEKTVDVLDNDTDADGDTLTISAVDGQAIVEGQTITTGAGTLVTLTGGELVVDGEVAYAALDIGEEALEDISYTVDDGQGGVVSANLAMTFCGDANSVASFQNALPTSGTYELEYAADGTSPFEGSAYDLRFLDTGDARFDNVLIEEAYCLDFNTAARTVADGGPDNVGTLFGSQSAAALDAFDANTVSNANGLAGSENLDLINWVISQNFEDQGFSGWEVQFAVWELADNFDASLVNYDAFQDSDAASVQQIVDAALTQDGFEFSTGDTVGIIVDPGLADADNIQPFIVGLDWETFDCLC